MKNNTKHTIESIKSLGKERSNENLDYLLKLYKSDINLDLKREIVSSIGRQNNYDKIIEFINEEAFNDKNPMELIYQMFRTCLYREKDDKRFGELKYKIINEFNNENINKMNSYYLYRHKKIKPKVVTEGVKKPLLFVGDSTETLNRLEEGSVQLIFTSPPYYNAREYSNYRSYEQYLEKMKSIFISCNRVLEDGRFFIINVSPVITKRPGREFESIRYPIPYDFHKLLEEAGFYYIDEIIWIKPEPSVPNRNGGYLQTRKPLSYKPNCITESIMVYRKKCDFLLDKNMSKYKNYDKYEDEEIDSSNCWYIAPKSDKNHPAVFPDELCRRILKYYSFKGDAVLDPFAGSGTFGRVAKDMDRIPVLCEINEKFIRLINEEDKDYYDIRR